MLSVKNADFEYDDLVVRAEEVKTNLDIIYSTSPLQEKPNLDAINSLLVSIREKFYQYGNRK